MLCATILGNLALKTLRSTPEEGSAARSALSGATPGTLPSPPARAPRLYLGGSNLYVGQTVQLTTEQTRYLVSVMRLRDGSLVRVFDGVNGEFLAVVLGNGGRIITSRARRSGSGGDQAVELRVDCLTRRQPRQDEGTPYTEVMFAPIRKQRLKMLVEKAVEIGASRLTPVLTARTQKGAVSDSKALGKLGLVTAVEAAEQCERMTVPCVGVTPVPLLSLLRDLDLQLSKKPTASGGARAEGKTDREQGRLSPGTIFVCKERDVDAPPILEVGITLRQGSFTIRATRSWRRSLFSYRLRDPRSNMPPFTSFMACFLEQL